MIISTSGAPFLVIEWNFNQSSLWSYCALSTNSTIMLQQYCFWNFHCTKAILNWIEMNWIGKILCYNSQPCTAVIVINQLNKLLALYSNSVFVLFQAVFPFLAVQDSGCTHSCDTPIGKSQSACIGLIYVSIMLNACREKETICFTLISNVSIHLQMFFLDLNTECIQFVLNT